jgi:hypothetical protein
MTCKRIAKLLSELQDRDLPFSRRLAIRLHLSWCIFCRRLATHLEILRQVSREIGLAAATDDLAGLDATLSPDAKDRMKKTLAEKNR